MKTCQSVIPTSGATCGRPAKGAIVPGNTPVCGIHRRAHEARGGETTHPERTIVDADGRHQNAGWRWITFADGARHHMTVNQALSIDNSADAQIMLADDEHLLRTFAHVTHMMHTANNDAGVAKHRANRDVAEAEILRRMAR